ncbi:TPA: hypothetical protein ACGG79_003483 [Vibrio cholerae]|uniref:AbiTii domain-containing protein n=1 Tax=Vibrio cholerae TaxID=666 RepID=UPI00330F1BAC|nr:hypothetical protein [Vibrio cholerae]EJL6916791.1 hypothetical protein [Vibrio cholerae]HBK7236234.1 hypothetical protein [Vibrio cholerae]HBK7239830.1 hypothetical protein [Vibrio cholerae]HDI3149777.1 hypothetical protein [Vibrio cholerae]
MILIDEIIEILSSEESNLKTALLKTKVLLHKLGEKDILDWVDSELRGYQYIELLPSYRVIHVSVLGNVSNMAYRQTHQVLPMMHLDDSIREKLDTRFLTESIAVINEYSKRDDLQITIAPEFYPLLSKGLSNGYQVEAAWGIVSSGVMTQVLTEVNSRLLDFVLELSEKFPAEMDTEEMRLRAKEVGVSDLFNNAVFGDNTTIIVGDSNTQNVRNSINKNDISSLIEVLKQNKVSDADISSLKEAIEKDKGCENIQAGKFGKEVSGWIGNMVSKAASTVWDIKVGAAGSLLATAIGKYYGF